MEAEAAAIETRRRSRSNTPFLRSSCDHETCNDAGHSHNARKKSPAKKLPNVKTITEEIEVSSPVVSSVRRTTRVVTSIVTSSGDGVQSSDGDSSSSKNSAALKDASALTASKSSSTSSYNTVVTKSSQEKQQQQQQQQHQQKHQERTIHNSEFKESNQNYINNLFELNQSIKTSTPIQSASGTGNIRQAYSELKQQQQKHQQQQYKEQAESSSDYSNGNINDHMAYKEYKEAGEYWNKFPKTDYTYSKLSPHRRELAPGIVAMPNMSRQGLRHHSARVEQMIVDNPEEEIFIRKRYYQTTNYKTSTNANYDNHNYNNNNINTTRTTFTKQDYYDSQDETDINDQVEKYRREYLLRASNIRIQQQKLIQQSLIQRFFTKITTIFYWMTNVYTGKNNSYMSTSNYRYARMEEKGFFQRIFSYISNSILSVFRYVYLGIASILCWDTWLLHTEHSNNRNKKRFLLLLLLLLPLLLLGGIYYYYDKTPPYPNIVIENYIDPIYMNDLKIMSAKRFDDLKVLSSDYYLYMKGISENVAFHLKNIWHERFSAWHRADQQQRDLIYAKLPTSVVSSLTTASSSISLPSTALLLQNIPLAAAWTTVKSYSNYTTDYLRNAVLLNLTFDFNWLNALNPKPLFKLFTSHQQQYHTYNFNEHSHTTTTKTIRDSLNDQQYADLLNHINVYIEKIISDKYPINNPLKSQRVDEDSIKLGSKVTSGILEIVKEQIFLYKYQLNDNDIDMIANVVHAKLLNSNSFKESIHGSMPLKITQTHIEEISRVVKENLANQQQQQQSKSAPSSSSDIDINELIFQILKSPKLSALIDERTSTIITSTQSSPSSPITINKLSIADQQSIVNNLVDDINKIKLQLTERLQSHGNLEMSLNLLKNDQATLTDRINSNENTFNVRLEQLLNEIDIKINNMNKKQFAAINDHVKLVLLDIIGYKLTDGQSLNDIDLKNWIRTVFVAKDMLEERLIELNDRINKKLADEKDKMAAILFSDITTRIKQEVLIIIEQKENSERKMNVVHSQHQKSAVRDGSDGHNGYSASLDELTIKRIVSEALSIYDADKTGMVDYALESAGGEVLSTRCTENYNTNTAQLTIFGIPLWYKTNTPRTVISPTVSPGECWAFQGFPGYLVLKLNHEIYINGFTIEHIPKRLSPNGKIESAPRKFTVWGLETEKDQNPIHFGKYEYKENGTSLQFFQVQNNEIDRPYNIIELRIESNHGNENYTCLYRFRVHGQTTPHK